MLLAGDVNGTRNELAIFLVEGGPHAPLTQAKVHSADYPSDVAGPLSNGHVKVTNLPRRLMNFRSREIDSSSASIC